jgi:LmbE family N-acetylglucosaminyl deacetylase
MSESEPVVDSSNRTKKKILTVGDGDLTLSLALARAYGQEHVSLTATVLEASPEEHFQAFPDAPLQELQERGVSVLYGVDATQLHQQSAVATTCWDVVSFHHPHLGQRTLMEGQEKEHVERHHQLLCHYLFSASQISDLVHVCLCGTQPETWKLLEAANQQNLTLIKTVSTAAPFARIWTTTSTLEEKSSGDDDNQKDKEESMPEPSPALSGFAAPRRYRNGKLGSRHFLGKYGYRHRRTEGDLYTGNSQDMNVSMSLHYVFAKSEHDTMESEKGTPNENACFICGCVFESTAVLEHHLLAPARPDFTRQKSNGGPSERQNSPAEPVTSSKRDLPSSTLRELSQFQQLMTTTVPEDCHQKRLRWFLQHHTIQGLSKRCAGSIIQKGLVLVNDAVALDKSRILQTGDQVMLLQDSSSVSPCEVPTGPTGQSLNIEVFHRSPSLDTVVVWKHAGMRTKGDFTGTLESVTSQHEGKQYRSITSMETSCPGFCILVGARHSGLTSHLLPPRYYVTVLVHGKVPIQWYPSKTFFIRKEAKWREKRRRTKKKDGCEEEEEVSSVNEVLSQISIVVTPLETALLCDPVDGSTASLSTLQVLTTDPSSGSLCQFFRNACYPVVGDTFCKKEYLTLKRSIRNRLKDNLCLGCYKIEIEGLLGKVENDVTTVQRVVPEKLSAKHWGRFLEDQMISKPSLKSGVSTTQKVNVIVFAHPDDESMFFLPTIQSLKQEEPTSMIWLLCLTNGNYNGLGKVREKELLEVGKLLEVDKTIIQDNPLLQDHPTQRWDKVVVAAAIRSALSHHQKPLLLADVQSEFVLFTFDQRGVSGHRNHIDTHLGVSHFMVQQQLNSQVSSSGNTSNDLVVKEAWQLYSEPNVIFKYVPVFSWLFLLLSFVSSWNPPRTTTTTNTNAPDNMKVIRVFRLHDPLLNWRAMKTHASQFVWYRRLFVVFSCYTYYNQLRLITRISNSRDNKKTK